MEDLKNKKFGMLTAREYLGKGKWKCECECGNFTEVFTENLKSMHTTSCGCKKWNKSAILVQFIYFY